MPDDSWAATPTPAPVADATPVPSPAPVALAADPSATPAPADDVPPGPTPAPEPAPTPYVPRDDAVPAQPPAGPVATGPGPDMWEEGLEGSLTVGYLKGTESVAWGESRRGEQGDYLATVKGKELVGLEVGPTAEAEAPTVKEGFDVSGSVLGGGQVAVSWSEPTQQAADDRRASLVPDLLTGQPPPMPAVVDAQLTSKATVKVEGGDADLGGAVSVGLDGNHGVKVELANGDSGASVQSVTAYATTGATAGGELDVGGVVRIVGEVKGEEQTALKVGADGAVASLKLTGEETNGIQSAQDAVTAKGVGGTKVEVEVSVPVGLDDVTSGRTLTQSSISVKTSDTLTGEASYALKLGPDPEGARLAAEGKVTTKEEQTTSSWKDTIVDVIQSTWQRLTGGS